MPGIIICRRWNGKSYQTEIEAVAHGHKFASRHRSVCSSILSEASRTFIIEQKYGAACIKIVVDAMLSCQDIWCSVIS